MRKSTITYSIQAAAYPQRLREKLLARRDQGSISVEAVVIALGLFALATLVVSLLTGWAQSKLGGLS